MFCILAGLPHQNTQLQQHKHTDAAFQLTLFHPAATPLFLWTSFTNTSYNEGRLMRDSTEIFVGYRPNMCETYARWHKNLVLWTASDIDLAAPDNPARSTRSLGAACFRALLESSHVHLGLLQQTKKRIVERQEDNTRAHTRKIVPLLFWWTYVRCCRKPSARFVELSANYVSRTEKWVASAADLEALGDIQNNPLTFRLGRATDLPRIPSNTNTEQRVCFACRAFQGNSH